MAAKAEFDLALNASGFNKSLKSAERSVESLQPRIEKGATAVSGLASAFGGVGSKAGASLGAASNFAAAFMEGGLVLGGIVAGVTALSYLWQEWDKVTKAEKAAREEAANAAKTLAERIEEDNKKLGIANRAKLLGITQERAEYEALRDEYNFMREEMYSVNAAVIRETESHLTNAQAVERANEIRKDYAAQLKVMEPELERLRVLVAENNDQQALAAELAQKEKDAAEALRKALRALGKSRKEQVDILAEQVDGQAWLVRMTAEAEEEGARRRGQATLARLEEEKQAREDAFAAETQQIEWFAQMRADAEAEGARRRLAAEQEAQEKRRALLQSGRDEVLRITSEMYARAEDVTVGFASTSLNVLEDLAAGQEVHFDRIMFSFLRQQGESIMGLSTRFGFEAAGRLISTQGADMAAWGLLAHAGSGFALGASMGATGAVGSGLSQRFGGLGMTIPAAGGGEAAGGGPVALDQTRAVSRRTEAESVSTTIVFQGTVFGDPAKQGRELARMQDTARSDYLERV
jgi:hypothetical protein